MGRTVPSFRMVIDSESARMLDYFGKKLDKSDRERLRRILEMSKAHSFQCGDAVRIFPFEAILMAILLERQKIIEALEEPKSPTEHDTITSCSSLKEVRSQL